MTTDHTTTADVEVSIEDCIAYMNEEMTKDIAYHLDALDKRRPGAGKDFLRQLAGIAQLTLTEEDVLVPRTVPLTDAAAEIESLPRMTGICHATGRAIVTVR